MNLTNYLSRVAMSNTEALGRTEMAKQRMEQELARKQEEAQGQAIGGLAGAVLGAGIGAYQKYNSGQESQDALRGFEARKGFEDRLVDSATQGKADLAANVGPVSSAYQSGLDRTAALRAEMADATQVLPRISSREPMFYDSRPEVAAPTGVEGKRGTGVSLARPEGMIPGRVAEEVRNDPVRDWEKLNAEDGERAADMLGLDMGRFIRRNLR